MYDTGARYPSGFDLGEATVLPSIHALGIPRLDMLMISHGDNDHAGGAEAVASAFPQAQRYAGEPARLARMKLPPMRAVRRRAVMAMGWRAFPRAESAWRRG